MKRNNMREIKFRVWSNRRKRYLNNERDNPNDNSYHVEGNVNEQIYCIARFLGEHDGEEDAILEQYTGLQDKNGVDIYEGDIVEFDDFHSPNELLKKYLCESPKQISWGLNHGQYPNAGWVAISIRPADLEDGHALNWMDARNMKVIGNIHEDPAVYHYSNYKPHM